MNNAAAWRRTLVRLSRRRFMRLLCPRTGERVGRVTVYPHAVTKRKR